MGLFDIFKKKKDAVSLKKPPTPSADITTAPSASFLQNEVIPIEKRISGQQPSCDELYPHEVLVLSYAPKFCVGENEFQGFWWYKYGIKDVQAILNSLAIRGFIQQSSIAEAVNMETLTLIKKELQKRELKTSGKKADLIARLVENVPENELAVIFNRRPYSLTEKGNQILKKYEWIPFIHRHIIEDLNIWNLTEIVQTPPIMKYRDKIWGYLNKRGIEHIQHLDFGLYRNSRLTMSSFVADDNKPENAFFLLCEVVAYDLSGLSNGFRMERISITAEHYFPYERSIVKTAPGVIAQMKKYADSFSWTEAVFHNRIAAEIEKMKLPFSVFTPEECADIVIAEIHEDKEALNRIYTSAEERFKKRL